MEETIFTLIVDLMDAYVLRSKERYKLRLAQLEVELFKFKRDNNYEHEQSKRLINFYERMWEF